MFKFIAGIVTGIVLMTYWETETHQVLDNVVQKSKEVINGDLSSGFALPNKRIPVNENPLPFTLQPNPQSEAGEAAQRQMPSLFPLETDPKDIALKDPSENTPGVSEFPKSSSAAFISSSDNNLSLPSAGGSRPNLTWQHLYDYLNGREVNRQ